ncbi:MAG: DUF5666 domain-containing protein [Terriglobales bacterium]
MAPKRRPIATLKMFVVVVCVALLAASQPAAAAQKEGTQQTGTPKSRVKAVGTIKSITGNAITVTTDTGAEVNVIIQPSTRLVRSVPGQTDLKSASPIQMPDLQVGDRLLASGIASEDGKSVLAATAIVMKKADIAAKQEQDREEWQKHGVGGVVKAVDARTETIKISTGTLAAETFTIHVSQNTIIRRYAPDSVKFDDAKPGTLDQIKTGDQLRARGTRSADGSELAADEIASGTFRNIAGTVVATDQGNNSVTVMDLASRRPVTLKVSTDSQLHKLPPMMAQRIAMRLKGITPSGPGAGGAAGGSPGMANAEGPLPRNGPGQRPGGTPDFQQMLSRMPAVTLADLQKGDALMIVGTEGTADSPSSAIILLSGVEPILTAAPTQASTILSPWNLSTGGVAGAMGDTP